jgi:methionine-gamma-lyase
MTHRIVDAESRRQHGISPGLIRMSVGLEDADDLWADLTRR